MEAAEVAAKAGPPPPASVGGTRLPPPAYRDDLSSRFADSAHVADSGPRGSGSGSVNSFSHATPSQSPPYGAPASSSHPQQHVPPAVTTAAVVRSKAPAYGEGMPAAPAPAGVSVTADINTAGNGHRQTRPKSPVRSHDKDPTTTKASAASRTPAATSIEIPQASTVAAPPANPESASASTSTGVPSTGRGGGYGLDAELAAKREANYDYDAEAEAREWIEDVTGQEFADEFGEELRNGSKLCELINAIKPGAVRRVNASKMPFKQVC